MVDHEAVSTDSGAERPYLPAMGRRWLLPLYDPITRLAGLARIHRELVEHANLQAGLRVLEIGCGPGGLLQRVHRRFPDVDLAGLDPDPAALARARRKLGPAVRLDLGFADALPYPDASIDRVLSSFMWHHLDPTDRPRALREIIRVLRPGGQLHLVDIAGATDIDGARAIHGLLARRAHRRAPHAHDVDDAHNGPDDLLALLRQAGLTDIAAAEQATSRLGPHTFYHATR